MDSQTQSKKWDSQTHASICVGIDRKKTFSKATGDDVRDRTLGGVCQHSYALIAALC
jgi:hypothetical protein